MLESLTAQEYLYWQIFYSIEPLPEVRADRRAAEIMQMIAASAHAKRIPPLSKLMPDYWQDRAGKQTPEQIRAALNIALRAPKAK